jgi:hypothetical protein
MIVNRNDTLFPPDHKIEKVAKYFNFLPVEKTPPLDRGRKKSPASAADPSPLYGVPSESANTSFV